MTAVLGPWWETLRYHQTQNQFYLDERRFLIACAGRRSGKTKLAKMKAAKRILRCRRQRGKFVFGAPTRDQAKRIFWDDLKLMFPKQLIVDVRESELIVELAMGHRCFVVGMDRPERAEGEAIDGAILDEFADMREAAWTRSVRPAMSTLNRLGWAIFTGKPRGRNHYWRLIQEALKTENKHDWGYYHWTSAGIVDPAEIEAARRSMDPVSFQQEYEASFVNFEGRAYYAFTRERNMRDVQLIPGQPLRICFDFNVAPGVAVVAQEQVIGGRNVTACCDEVYIENNSNTLLVCQRLAARYRDWSGPIYLYGDATGGNRGTAKIGGSDWDIITQEFARQFKTRAVTRVKRKNPPERARINAVNTRFLTADGSVNCYVSPRCAKLADDLEGVQTNSSGEIDKNYDLSLTHMSDAFGYYVEYEFPVQDETFVEELI